VCRALVGGTNYSDIYVSSEIEDDDMSKTSNNSTSTTGIDHSNDHHRKVPTLQEIARKVARLEKMQLDEKQYISYEMIACTVLLGLVKDGHDSNTTLFTSHQKNLGGNPSAEIEDIVKRLKASGGQDQLLMILTWPARSGKSKTMRMAEQFCYEFCVAVGVMWCDRTYLCTAYTGSAPSLIGGVTISKAAYINQNKQLSADDINEWKDVRILVIDEVSFMSNNILKTLNYKLMIIGNRSKSVGGFSIIFAGDFHQLNPFVQKSLILCSQVWHPIYGKTISMPSLFQIMNNASKKNLTMAISIKECGMVI
jgi:hypothetical protein